MKANEAPEKLYFNQHTAQYNQERRNDDDIEYTRTDAFIEKACGWLENNLQGIVGGSIYIGDFRNYMKGE